MNKIEGMLPVKNTLTRNSGAATLSETVSFGKQEKEEGERDDLVLTGLAVTLKQAEKSQQQVPEMDLDKVAELKKKIAQGSYQVSAGRVAQKMMDFERMR